MPAEQGSESAVVVQKTYDLLLWLLPKAEKFPRSFRFSVGDRLVAVGLDLLLALVEAAYSRDKADLLETASRKDKWGGPAPELSVRGLRPELGRFRSLRAPQPLLPGPDPDARSMRRQVMQGSPAL